jgi:hypothetical protein
MLSRNSYQIGDSVTFGKYNHEPIRWRVIHIDEQGDPLLLAERILMIKAFDATSELHDDTDRKCGGSNLWMSSNLRQWLNSDEQQVNWIHHQPSMTNLLGSYNAYDTEKGFLANGNFSADERKQIKPYKHAVLLPEVNVLMKEGGTELHQDEYGDPIVACSHDVRSYHHFVTDRVFLLSVRQWVDYVYNQQSILGTDFHRAKPTTSAIERCGKIEHLSDKHAWDYWLNTPFAQSSEYIRYVDSSGQIDDRVACSDFMGVRPALVLDFKN